MMAIRFAAFTLAATCLIALAITPNSPATLIIAGFFSPALPLSHGRAAVGRKAMCNTCLHPSADEILDMLDRAADDALEEDRDDA